MPNGKVITDEMVREAGRVKPPVAPPTVPTIPTYREDRQLWEAAKRYPAEVPPITPIAEEQPIVPEFPPEGIKFNIEGIEYTRKPNDTIWVQDRHIGSIDPQTETFRKLTEKEAQADQIVRERDIYEKYPKAPYTKEQMKENWYKEMTAEKGKIQREYEEASAFAKSFEESLAGKSFAFLLKGMEQAFTEAGALITAPFRYKKQPLAEYLSIYPGMKGYEIYKEWKGTPAEPSIPVGIPSWKQLGVYLKSDWLLKQLGVDTSGWEEPQKYEMARLGMGETAEWLPLIFGGVIVRGVKEVAGITPEVFKPISRQAASRLLAKELSSKEPILKTTEGGRLVLMPTSEELMWDVTSKFAGKPEKLIEKPIIRIFARLLDPKLVARNPVEQLKIYQGIMRDISEGATDLALRPVRAIQAKLPRKIRIKNGIVVDKRIKPLENAPKIEGKPSMNIHDIVEYAERYKMPAGLRAYFDEIRNVSKQTTEMLEKELARFDIPMKKLKGEADWVYLHRVVTKVGEIENLRIKGWRSATKPRSLELAGVGEKLPKPVKYLEDPVAELQIQIEGAYAWITELRIKEGLKAITRTAKETVKPAIIDDLVNKNSIRIAADHLKKLISRAKRGETLPTVSLNAVDRKFPEISAELRAIMRGEVRPTKVPIKPTKKILAARSEAESQITKLTKEAAGNEKLLRSHIAEEIANIEYELGLRAMPYHGGVKTALFPDLTSKQLDEMLRVYKSFGKAPIAPLITEKVITSKAVALNKLAKQATQLVNTSKEEFWAAKSIYQRALKQAGPSIEEGTTRYFGGRIFTTQQLIKPTKEITYKFDPKGFRFVPTTGEGKVILGRDLALEVDRQFGYRLPGVLERVTAKLGTFGGILRETKASVDLSVQFIQTQLGGLGLDTWNLLTLRPSANWIKGAGRGVQAGFMPRSYAKWAGKPEVITACQEMITHRALIQASEYTEALGVLAPLLRKTVVGRPAALIYTRANSAFTAGRVSTATYMWMGERQLATKGLTGTALAHRLDELGMWINKSTGVLSTRGMGINPTQRSIESVVMFAPRYTRAVVASVMDITRGGYTGAQAREAMLGLITAGMSFFTFVPMALGQKPRLNPLPESMGGDGAKWLTIQVGNSYVGVGGTIYGLARLLANNWATLTENPEALFKLDMTNPNVRFIRAKFGPPLALGIDYVTGKGYLGNLTRENWVQVMGTALDWLIPIWVGGYIGEEWYDRLAEKQPLDTHPEAILPEIIGMRTIPVTEYDKYMALRDVYSMRDLGVHYRDIEDNADRDSLFRNHPDLEELRITVSKDFEKRGSTFERWYAEKSRTIKEERTEKMEVLATALINGEITQQEWRNQRSYIKPYTSGYLACLWDAREKFDVDTIKVIEKYVEKQSNNDKALDKYQEISNTPEIDPKTGQPNWDKRERDLNSFLESLSPTAREYVLGHKNDYIYDYSPNTQKVERLFIECQEGIDAYYALPEGKERLAYRDAHPEIDAKLIILRGLKPRTGFDLAIGLLDKYGISRTLLGEITPPVPVLLKPIPTPPRGGIITDEQVEAAGRG